MLLGPKINTFRIYLLFVLENTKNMAKYLLALTVLLYSFTGYSQQTWYNFHYQFAPVYKQNKEFTFNKEGMKDEAYKEIFKNTSISGIMYKNGT